MVFEPGSVIQMKYSNVFVIAVLISIAAAAGVACFADDADATASNSGVAFVDDFNTLLKGSVGEDIVQVTYTDDAVEILLDPSYASLVPMVDTAQLKSDFYQTFITYDTFNIGSIYLVENHVPDVDTSANMFIIMIGMAQKTLCEAEPGEITVFSSDEFYVLKDGYEPYTGGIVIKVNATQADIDFTNFVSEYIWIEPSGKINFFLNLTGADREMNLFDLAYGASKTTAAEFFGDEVNANRVNFVIEKLLEYPGIVNTGVFAWEDDGEIYSVALEGFAPGEGKDAFQKLFSGICNSTAVLPGFQNGWLVPLKTFENAVTGNFTVNDGIAAANYYTGYGTVVTLKTHFDATIVPGYDNSGKAFVNDMNRFFETVFGDDKTAYGVYSDECLSFYFDYSTVYNMEAELNLGDLAETMAIDILSSYDLFSVNDVPYVIDGKPVTSSAKQLLYIITDMYHTVCESTPGYVNLFTSDTFSVKKMNLAQYDGAISLSTELDQFTIDAANYVSKFISIDPETLTIKVTGYIYGLSDTYTAEDLAFIYSHVPAIYLFDEKYVDYINWGCRMLMDEGGQYAPYFSIVWNDGNNYKLSLKNFTPGEGADDFQQLAAGIYNCMNQNPTGYSNGWDVPVSEFYVSENYYVAEGYGVVSVPGYEEFSVPVVASLTNLDRPFDISLRNIDHATVYIVPGLSPTKVAIFAIPDEGYEVGDITVIIDGKTYVFPNGSGFFELTGNATVDVESSEIAVKVTGVTLNPSSTTLDIGQLKVLTATVTPSNATNKAVTWSSSDSSIVSVNNGTILGLKAGTATITVTTVDGGYTATCTVTVKNPYIAVSGVTLSPSSAILEIGQLKVLTATVAPYNATNKAVTWSSSDSDIVSVNNGTILGLKAGTATITVTTVDGGYTATCNVTVKNPYIAVSGVTLNTDALTVNVGSSTVLTATVTPYNATNKAVTWSSSYSSIASVNNGTVTGVKAGTAVVTVTTADGAYTDSCTVTVVEPGPQVIPVTGVSISQSSKTIELGEEFTLTATVTPYNATDKTVRWSTSDASIATVNNGVVRGVGVGEAEITVTTVDGGYTASCTVTVVGTDVKVTGVTVVPESVEVIVGNTVTLTATVVPYTATNQNVSWASSDSSIASVDKDGVVTAIAIGTTTITVTTEDGGFTDTCTVTVVKNPVVSVTGVTLDKSTATVTVGESVTLSATVLPSDATNKNLSWSTSNSKVATVVDGVVKGVSEGTATITVTTEDGSHTATCVVTVNPAEEPSSGGDNTLLYVGVAAGIILVILAAALLMRRRS